MAVVERACLPQATLHIGECLLDVVRALRWARHPSGLALVLLWALPPLLLASSDSLPSQLVHELTTKPQRMRSLR
jgi:hypothetical protein